MLFCFHTVEAQQQRVTNLGDVVVTFCNDESMTWGTRSLVLDADPEEEVSLCMLVTNGGPTDTTISLNFVDGTITSDSDQKKACEPEHMVTNFGQYITQYPDQLRIQAWKTVKIEAKAQFPAWYAWMAYWCATFQIVPDGWVATWWQSQMFNIISRRASFVDINVKWEYRIDLQAHDATMEWSYAWLTDSRLSVVNSLLLPWHTVDAVLSTKNPLMMRIGKPLMVRSVLVNSGNVGIEATIDTTYRTWWWLWQISLPTQSQQLVPAQRKAIEMDVDQVAWWLGGPVQVTQTITYKPVILGSADTIDPSFLEPQTITLVSSWFIVVWQSWIVLWWWVMLVVIWIMYITLRNRSISRRRRGK